MRTAIIQRDDDDAARAVENTPRIAAARVGEIFHFARIAALEPFGESLEFFKGGRLRDAAEIESQSFRLLRDPIGVLLACHRNMMHQTVRCGTSMPFGAKQTAP